MSPTPGLERVLDSLAARLLLSALSAYLLSRSLPGKGWPGAAWFALVPLWVALHGGGVARGALLGAAWAGMLLMLSGDLAPLAGGWSPWVAYLLLQGVVGAGAGWLTLREGGSDPLRPALLAAVWTTGGWIIEHVPAAGLVPSLAATQVDLLPFIQMADRAGPHALTFVVALFSATLALLLIGALQDLSSGRPSGFFEESGGEGAARRGMLAVVIVMLALALGYGARCGDAQPDGTATVRLGCLSIRAGGAGSPGGAGGTGWGGQLEAARGTVREQHDSSTPLVLALDFGAAAPDAGTRADLARLAGKRPAAYLCPWEEGARARAAIVEARASEPFSWPTSDGGSSQARSATWRDYLVRVTLVEGGAALQARAQLAARYGTELIAVLWPRAGAAPAASQAARLAEARLCAVCLRRWVLLQDAAGGGAVIDPWGRLLVTSSPASQGAIAAVRLHAERSLYERKGDLFLPVVLLGLVAGLVRRAKRGAAALKQRS